MATHTRNSGLLSSLFPESPSIPTDYQKEKSEPGADLSYSDGEISGFVGRAAADRNPIFRDCVSNGFSSDAQLKYLHSDKEMLLETSATRSCGEIIVGSMTQSIDGVLDITIHHARDIHNICIYGNQDVYAKFSITHTQDTVYSTQPVRAGGKNPVFNQSLQILISRPDAVLKCEIWMMSCARTYLEDQLLGFVLVPLADLVGKGKHTQDYTLSSTDLFHTPAGTVCLSLVFYSHHAAVEAPLSTSHRSPDLMDSVHQCVTPMDYNNVEFPDLQAVSENQQLVSVYLKMVSGDIECARRNLGHDDIRMADQQKEFSGASFLQLGSSPMGEVDCEMSLNNGEERSEGGTPLSSNALPSSSDDTTLSVEAPSSSPSVNTVTISTTTDEGSSVVSLDAIPARSVDLPPSGTHFYGTNSQATPSPGSVSSGSGHSPSDDKVNGSSDGQESSGSFTAPLVSISMEPEEPVVQQQIVDMYMKSMQQFTESLAKMKLPLDLDGGQGRVETKNNAPAEKKDTTEPGKKDGHRVFYGSRAFF